MKYSRNAFGSMVDANWQTELNRRQLLTNASVGALGLSLLTSGTVSATQPEDCRLLLRGEASC